MDWPSSSWLFIRVGAFFSSFSYTNSSRRTSADSNKKTQLQSHKTTVREPNVGSDFRTWSPNSRPDIRNIQAFTITTMIRKIRDFVSRYHITCANTGKPSQHVGGVLYMNVEKVEQVQFTTSKTVTQDCDQQLVCLCLLCLCCSTTTA